MQHLSSRTPCQGLDSSCFQSQIRTLGRFADLFWAAGLSSQSLRRGQSQLSGSGEAKPGGRTQNYGEEDGPHSADRI